MLDLESLLKFCFAIVLLLTVAKVALPRALPFLPLGGGDIQQAGIVVFGAYSLREILLVIGL